MTGSLFPCMAPRSINLTPHPSLALLDKQPGLPKQGNVAHKIPTNI